MQLTRYLKTWPSPDDPDRILLLATRRCSVLELSTALWQRVQSGDLGESETATLAELGVLVPDRDAEMEEMKGTFDAINAASRHVSVTVTLTLACNLACPYCYEAPFRQNQVMSTGTADLLVARLGKRMAAGMDVTVDFYGGEALLNLELLITTARRLKYAALRHGVRFDFNIFSNGVLLTPGTVVDLLSLGLAGVRLTIDGPPEIHDRQRPFASGRGSFDAILSNLLAVHRLVPVDLGGNYTVENYRRFPGLLDLLIEAGIEPGRLKQVAFTPVMPRSDGTLADGPGSACACANEPWAIEAAVYLRGETIRRGFPVNKIRPSACMVEFDNDLVVGHDGGFYKCPVFMGSEELRVGSLAEGVREYRASHNLELWKNDDCLACAYLPLCFGGCRFFRRLESNSFDAPDCRRGMYDAGLERLVRQDLGAGNVKTRHAETADL